ncbi:MAG: ribosome silencing factor [Eubacterium sp.]|jgi:ribosome-associated protein|nr:ribosome silencing factor [Eubacterium sp.]
MSDLETIKTAVKALDGKKAKDIKVIKIEDLSSLTNYFVLASGSSSTQVKALADEIEIKLRAVGLEPKRTEGYNGANWIVLDYIDVIFHIFHDETRDFYDLERLWTDGEIIPAEELI